MIPPLFIPLRKEYYTAFLDGSKDTEMRPFGKRWNNKTCYPGRPVTLSMGYGKQARASGYIKDIIVCYSTSLSHAQQRDLFKIYGERFMQIILIEIHHITEQINHFREVTKMVELQKGLGTSYVTKNHKIIGNKNI